MVKNQIDIELLEEYLSEDRLSTYIELAKGNQEKAIELYIQNKSISEKLYSSLAELEVILRNAINNTLSKEIGAEWYNKNSVLIIPKHKEVVEKVTYEITKDRKEVNNPNIISNLNFGFWVYLFNADYDQNLWSKHLHKVFTNKPKGFKRGRVRMELDKFKKIRNRIAHCECILKYPYEKNYKEVIEFLSWINPEISKWVDSIVGGQPL